MTAEKPISRSPWPARLYSWAVFALMIRYLLLLIWYKEPYQTPWYIAVAQVSVATAGILLGRMWKKKTFWIFIAYLALMFCRVWFDDPTHLTTENCAPQMLIHGLWVFGACYSVGEILNGKQLKNFMRVFAAAWTVGFTAHCLLALYAAWTGAPVWNASHGSFWGFSKALGDGNLGMYELNATGGGEGVRLQVVIWCSVSGAMTSISGMVALCGAAAEKKTWLRILYILCLIPLFFTIGLTDTRASHISFSAGAGALIGILMIRHFARRNGQIHPGEKPKGGRVFGWWTGAVCTGLAVMVLGIYLFGLTPKIYTQLHSGTLVSSAFAEGAEETVTTLASRGYTGDLNRDLSNRVGIWQYVIQYLIDHPLSLLIGESIWIPMRGPNAQEWVTFVAGHPHNEVLWIVLQNGLPGLLLIAAAAWITVKRSVRLVNNPKTPLWLAILPVIVLSAFIGDLVETISGLLGFAYPNCSILLFCVGAICAGGRRQHGAENKNALTENPAL